STPEAASRYRQSISEVREASLARDKGMVLKREGVNEADRTTTLVSNTVVAALVAAAAAVLVLVVRRRKKMEE
ncbi:MAG: hypothetical protein K2O63_04670, partial [Alistipes sp.]|nr:hypothetical protein [Alistipes sp.]